MTTNAYKNTLHVYTPNDKDFARKADSLATALYEAAEQKAYQELSREELFAFLDQAASLQDSHTGLLKLCIDDMMPAAKIAIPAPSARSFSTTLPEF